MKPYYYECLPAEYTLVYRIDAGEKKTGIILNIVAFLVSIILIILLSLLKKISFELEYSLEVSFVLLGFALLLIFYVVIHELTHGLFYKIFTHKKLKFGLKLSCAFCGVPDIYMKKTPMVITALAPFIIYSILSIIALILLPANYISFLLIVFFAVHVGGCSGDIYVSLLLLFKYPKDVLIQDKGAEQSFYIKK